MFEPVDYITVPTMPPHLREGDHQAAPASGASPALGTEDID